MYDFTSRSEHLNFSFSIEMKTISNRYKPNKVEFVPRKSLKRRSKKHRSRINAKKKIRNDHRSLLLLGIMNENSYIKTGAIHKALLRVNRKQPRILNQRSSYQRLIDTKLSNDTITNHQSIFDNGNETQYGFTNDREWEQHIVHNQNQNGPSTSLENRSNLFARLKSKKNTQVYPSEKQEVQRSVLATVNIESKKNRKFYRSPYFIFTTAVIVGLVLAGIIIGITFASIKPIITTTLPSTSQTIVLLENHVCDTRNSSSCSIPMYYNLNVGYNDPSTWTWISCCYLAPTTSQLTIEFALQEDSGYWLIDDVSATQGSGELIIDGDFESNLTNWILTVYSNATSSIAVDTMSGGQHSGSGYLHGVSANALSYVKQTFSTIPGKNVLIGFWLNYAQTIGGVFGTSEMIVVIT